MHKKIPVLFVLAILTFVLTDPTTATLGMRNGIDICIKNLIPSLFPFFFLIGYLTEHLQAAHCNALTKRLLSFCKLPKGTEQVFLISLISGYPIGAAMICDLSKKGIIAHQEAKRMMGFCNNAGPAFIFGVGMCLFERKWIIWILWGIQILSSFLVARLLPSSLAATASDINCIEKKTPSNVMLNSMKSMCMVCGWVLIFRVITEFLELHVGNKLPSLGLLFLKGLLELSNGCVSLSTIDNEGLRFVLFNIFLSFGGLSVWLQVKSAAGSLFGSDFIYGKFLHIMFCALFSLITQSIFFSGRIPKRFLIGGILFCLFGICMLVYIIRSSKIKVAKQGVLMYNNRKFRKEA